MMPRFQVGDFVEVVDHFTERTSRVHVRGTIFLIHKHRYYVMWESEKGWGWYLEKELQFPKPQSGQAHSA